MKKIKIINGIFWTAITIVLNCIAVYHWFQMGTCVKGIVIGMCMYTAFCACFWFCIHNHLTEREHNLF